MKKIIIAGGGIAGLSAGIFALKNGFKATILEKHSISGGECTGWDRQGYHIDGCIHWLVGTKEGTNLKKLWDIVGALDGVDIYHPESFIAFEHSDVTVHFYRDLEKMRFSWIEISPEDADLIKKFCDDIKSLQSFNIPSDKPMDLMSVFEKIRLIFSMKSFLPLFQRYSKISVSDFASKFKHPALRNAINSFIPQGNYSMISVLFPLGTFTGNQSSIPFGGSKALSARMTERYISLGGEILTSCEVTDLKIEKRMVRELLCGDGRYFQGDYYIAACDPHVLYKKLLKGRYDDPEFVKRYNDPEKYPLASNIYVGIGYDGNMENTPRTIRFPANSINIEQNGKPIKYLQITHYDYEKDFAPKGHSVITVAINQFAPELDKWEKLVESKEEYKKEKNRIGDEVLKAVELRFPEMVGRLRLLDVVTPQTYKRYCNAYRGAFMGFWPTITGKQLDHTGKIKGLDNIFLSGQWLQPPGGLPVALITGKDTIMRICRKEKVAFKNQGVVY